MASASVPELTATASLVPMTLANSFSNSLTYFPQETLSESSILAMSSLDFLVIETVPKVISFFVPGDIFVSCNNNLPYFPAFRNFVAFL